MSLQFDVYNFGVPLGDVASLAREAERAGFSAMWFTESRHDPFLGCAVAALATETMHVGTGIAVAFPRSPMVTAQTAWDLAGASGGRFVLGLGTQVRAHIERRFSAEFSHPVARLREYILAVRAIWRAFAGEEPLAFRGEFFTHTLLSEFFTPEPIEHPDIPIYVAGVNKAIAEMAGGACDGFHIHPFHTPAYVTQAIVPAITRGLVAGGRHRGDITLACPVFMIVGDSDRELDRSRQAVRRQLAFYGSTRAYRPVLDLHGWGDAAERLNRLMAEGKTDEMMSAITDEMLEQVAVTATWSGLASALLDRYDGLVDRIFPYSGTSSWRSTPGELEAWTDVAAEVRAGRGART